MNEVGDGAMGTTKRTQRQAAAALQALDAAALVLILVKRARKGLYGFYRAPACTNGIKSWENQSRR
jgi:hypothetical protein